MVEKALYEEFIEYIHDILSYYESNRQLKKGLQQEVRHHQW